MRPWIPALFTAGLLATPTVLADDDHERAREALERGEILPLTEILARVSADYPGQVLETDFEREWFRYAYELTVLADSGHLLEIEVDAASGEILEVEREDD